jgi:hypothetical protein
MSTLLTPDIRRMIDDLKRRVGILERRVTGGGTATGTPANDDLIFSYPGTLAAAESPPAKLRYGGFLATLSVALGTAGSSATTLVVERNGTTVATIVVPSGFADYGATVGARVFPEDRITVEVVTAGTGAADMTAAARFT